MFIKRIDKSNLEGKKYTYYRLCESIRIGGKTRHNNLLNMGTLSELEEEDRKALANRIESLYLNTQKMVTTSIKNSEGHLILIKKCSQPGSEVTAIYQATKYSPMPFSLKKYVVPH